MTRVEGQREREVSRGEELAVDAGIVVYSGGLACFHHGFPKLRRARKGIRVSYFTSTVFLQGIKSVNLDNFGHLSINAML